MRKKTSDYLSLETLALGYALKHYFKMEEYVF